MKRKLVVGISLTMFLTVSLFIAFPVKSQWAGTIRIGAVGPMPWIQGKGIAEALKLAAKHINARGGILGPNGYKVDIVSADTLRGMPDPTTATGTAAAMELAAQGCNYVIGGFRTEATFGIREVLMDSAYADDKPIYFIAGAATNELIDCANDAFKTGKPCGACVRCDYDRYRFMFRNTPMNSTMLFYAIAGYLAYVMAGKMAPIFTGYATPLPISVISEDLTWADVMHYYLHDIGNYFWNVIIGVPGSVNVVHGARVSPVATDVSSELLAAQAAGAKVIIEVLSGPVGRTMAIQCHDLAIPAILSGIDVPGQEIPLHWTATAAKCEYESFLSTAGTRVPMTPQILAFWDAYMAEYGHAPIYTSYGAYDTCMGIEETINALGYWSGSAKEMVPYTEQTFRLKGGPPLYGTALMGTFKYTTPNPLSGQPAYGTYMCNATTSYAAVNPTMMGTLHELYHSPAELDKKWWYYPAAGLLYYARAQVSQWQWDPIAKEGKLQTFYPVNMPYSKRFIIPPYVYSHADTDVFGPAGYSDGLVSGFDTALVASTWLSKPGDTAWDFYGPSEIFPGLTCDIDLNGFINIADFSAIAMEVGYNAVVEYGQWPLP